MSVLSTTLAPAAAPAASASTHASGTAARADGNSGHAASAKGIVNSPAAVVSLVSVEGKARAASHGSEGRRVDAGYEKQEAKGGTETLQKEKKEADRTKVDVEA